MSTPTKTEDRPAAARPRWLSSIAPKVFIPAALVIFGLLAVSMILSNMDRIVDANNNLVSFSDDQIVKVDEDGNVVTGDGEPVSSIGGVAVQPDADGNIVDGTGEIVVAAGSVAKLDDGGALETTGTETTVAEYAMDETNAWVTGKLGWYYIIAVLFFIGASLAFGFSRFGKLKLAKSEDEEPEFSRFSWFAMLFSAGMGIGLVFYGAAEPLIHLREPPFLPAEAANSEAAARDAMLITFMHWGLHAWAIYVVLGLAIAYTVHRRGRPLSIRWVLEPLLGEQRVRGWLGDLIDVTAVVATLFGVATSLGLGSAQINSGLVAIFGDDLPSALTNESGGGTVLQYLIIAVITGIAIWSVMTGVKKGIKWLSNINMGVAGLLLAFFIIAGPTLFIMRDFLSSLGYYFQNILSISLDAGAFPVDDSIYSESGAFQTAWTIFYWGWWMSWAPFVAVFIARISRGRSIREFVAGVLLVPTVLSFIWFAALGGTGIDQSMNEGKEEQLNFGYAEDQGLFLVLENMPWTTLMTGIATLLVVTFFVTSSDSGSLVIDMLSSGGNINPPKLTRVFWALLEGGAAAALLLVGGLDALKTFAIILALPFSVILVAAVFATWQGLRSDYDAELRRHANKLSAVE